VTQLKEFVGYEFRRVLEQFLSLFPVTDRILPILEGIIPYVYSQNAAQ
jgi:hypothetical protein